MFGTEGKVAIAIAPESRSMHRSGSVLHGSLAIGRPSGGLVAACEVVSRLFSYCLDFFHSNDLFISRSWPRSLSLSLSLSLRSPPGQRVCTCNYAMDTFFQEYRLYFKFRNIKNRSTSLFPNRITFF